MPLLVSLLPHQKVSLPCHFLTSHHVVLSETSPSCFPVCFVFSCKKVSPSGKSLLRPRVPGATPCTPSQCLLPALLVLLTSPRRNSRGRQQSSPTPREERAARAGGGIVRLQEELRGLYQSDATEFLGFSRCFFLNERLRVVLWKRLTHRVGAPCPTAGDRREHAIHVFQISYQLGLKLRFLPSVISARFGIVSHIPAAFRTSNLGVAPSRSLIFHLTSSHKCLLTPYLVPATALALGESGDPGRAPGSAEGEGKRENG